MNSDAKKVFNKIGLSLAVSIIVIYLVQIILGNLFTIYAPFLVNSGWIAFILLGISFYIIGFPLCSFLVKSIPDCKITKHKKLSLKEIIVLFLISYFLMIVTNIFTLIILYFISLAKGTGPVTSPLENVVSNSNFLATFLFIGILSPIIEEILFRKVLLNKLRCYGDKIAIITTALLFGLFHGNFSQFFYAVVLGMVFAYVTLKTGTIKYSIILHILINMMGNVVGTLSLKSSILTSIFGICVIIFTIAGLILFIKNRNKISLLNGSFEIPKGAVFKTTCLNFGMILNFTLNMVLMFYLLLR